MVLLQTSPATPGKATQPPSSSLPHPNPFSPSLYPSDVPCLPCAVAPAPAAHFLVSQIVARSNLLPSCRHRSLYLHLLTNLRVCSLGSFAESQAVSLAIDREIVRMAIAPRWLPDEGAWVGRG